jgi:hypothetical protein
MLSLAHPDSMFFLAEANEREHIGAQRNFRSIVVGLIFLHKKSSSDESQLSSTVIAASHVSLTTLVEYYVELCARPRAIKNRDVHVRSWRIISAVIRKVDLS